MNTTKQSKDLSIQILRIIACFGVFLVHLGQRLNVSDIIRNFTDFGAYGVEMFFIISGYLALLSLDKKNEKTLPYYKKRAIRILPLYFFVVLFFFITEYFIWGNIPIDDKGLGWLRYIFVLNGIIGSDTYFWSNLGITWTIPMFLLFYLIAPWIFKVVKKLWSSLILLALSLIIAFVYPKYANGNLLILSYLPCFFIGSVIYFSLKENKTELSLLIFALLSLFYFITNWSSDYAYSFIFAIIFIAFNKLNIKAKNNLFTKIINVLDSYSFALYLGHGIIFCGIIDHLELSNLYNLLIAIFGTLTVTVILHNFIEKPCTSLLNRIKIKK